MVNTDWDALIAAAMAKPPQCPTAHTYLDQSWRTTSRPVLLGCDDGESYVVKSPQNGKVVVNEQIVGNIAQLIRAPVPLVRLINVPKDLIDLDLHNLGHLFPGLNHGSILQPNCGDRDWIANVDVPENGERFAALAVLFGWTHSGGDAQLIYHLSKPEVVYSVDHGNFFPEGPEWTEASLRSAPAASVRGDLADLATEQQVNDILDLLHTISMEQIAAAVASPPSDWPISLSERKAMAVFLEKRRVELLN